MFYSYEVIYIYIYVYILCNSAIRAVFCKAGAATAVAGHNIGPLLMAVTSYDDIDIISSYFII